MYKEDYGECGGVAIKKNELKYNTHLAVGFWRVI